MKKLLQTYASEGLQKRWRKRTLPVYIEYHGDSVFAQIVSFLHVNGLGKDIKYLDDKWLLNQLARGKFLILIDDVHKILGNPDVKDQSRLQELLQYSSNRFVLMSRDFFKRSDFGFPAYEISRLTDEKIGRILRFHTGESNAEMIFQYVRWNPKLRELYDTPQMLAFLARAFGRNGRIPLNKSSMFAEFFDQQMMQEEVKGTKYPRTLKKRLLGHLALSMLKNQQDPYRIDEQECLRILKSALTTLQSEYGYAVTDNVDVLSELLRAGLVVRYGQQFQFPHDQWQEYFAASELVERDENLNSLRHLGSFGELAFFVSGLHSLDSTQQAKDKCLRHLQQLMRLDFFLFSKCLANFQGERPQTLSYWHERYKDVIFSVGDIENAYGQFLEDYIEIITLHFPRLRHKFNPQSEKDIGVFVETNESRWGNWYAFFEVEPPNAKRVVVVERRKMANTLNIEDENALLESYRKQYGMLNFKARDIDPVLFRLPLIGARDEVKSQLKGLIRKQNLVEPSQLMLEKLYYEATALKTTLGIPRANRELTAKDISDGIRRRRIRESIQHRFLKGTSVDVRGLAEETERLLQEGFLPDRRRGSTTYAGIYSRAINEAEFENAFSQIVGTSPSRNDIPILPPLHELPQEFFQVPSWVRSVHDHEIVIDWLRDYFQKLYTNYKETVEANFPTSAFSFETYAHFPIVVALVVDKERFLEDGWLGSRHVFGNVTTAQNAVTVEVLDNEGFPVFEKSLYAHRWHQYSQLGLPNSYPNKEYLRNGVYDLIRREFDKLVR